MYNLPITELKSNYSTTIINRAISKWIGKFTESEISEKIDELQCFLERAGKNEFIKVYEYYMNYCPTDGQEVP